MLCRAIDAVGGDAGTKCLSRQAHRMCGHTRTRHISAPGLHAISHMAHAPPKSTAPARPTQPPVRPAAIGLRHIHAAVRQRAETGSAGTRRYRAAAAASSRRTTRGSTALLPVSLLVLFWPPHPSLYPPRYRRASPVGRPRGCMCAHAVVTLYTLYSRAGCGRHTCDCLTSVSSV